MATHTNQDQGVTKAELAEALIPLATKADLTGALEPIERRLETVEGHLRDVQEDVKAIRNFLMPMPPEDENANS